MGAEWHKMTPFCNEFLGAASFITRVFGEGLLFLSLEVTGFESVASCSAKQPSMKKKTITDLSSLMDEVAASRGQPSQNLKV